MCLHSSGMSGRQFSRLATRLVEAGYQAVLVDLTGQGQSPPVAEGVAMSWRDDVAAVVNLIDGPTKLVGHSLGGLVALHVALAAPVTKVVVYDPVAFGILDRTNDADALATLSPIDLHGGETEETREQWLKNFVEYWSGAGAWDALKEQLRAEFRRVGWAVREGVVKLMQDQTKAAGYAKLPPLALITGEHTPIAAQRVIQRLAEATGASITKIAGAGHMGPLSHADAVNAKIIELLA
jgi:pimeloyl-ACP methyl ester carboxylesterase